MDPNVVGLVAGIAGALVMLLVVMLALAAFVVPVLRSVLRFVGNFGSLSAQRQGGRIVVSGSLDDWREVEPPMVEARYPRPVPGPPVVVASPSSFESKP